MPFLFTLIFVSLMYLSPADLLPALAPYRPVLVTASVSAVLAVVSAPLNQFRWRAPQIYLLGGFCAAIAASWITRLWFGGAFRSVLEFAPSAVAFLTVAITASTLRRQRALGLVLVLLALLFTLLGGLAYHYGYAEQTYLFVRPLRGEEGEPLDETIRRIRGPGILHDPNDLAQNLLLALVLLGAWWRPRRPVRNLFVLGVPAAALLYGLVLTRSRGAAVSLAVAVGLTLRERVGRMGGALMSALLAAGLLAANFGGARAVDIREASIAGRLEAWSTGLQMLKRAPLLGVGYGSFTEYHELTAHNSFVLCFAELGMVGYFFWMALLVATGRQLAALSRLSVSDPVQAAARRWARMLHVAFYSFLASSWFLSRTYMPTLYILVGLVVALSELAERNGWIRAPRWDRRLLLQTLTLQVASVALIYFTVRLRSL